MSSSSQIDPALRARCLAARHRPALNWILSCSNLSAEVQSSILVWVQIWTVVESVEVFCCFGQGKLKSLWLLFMGKNGVVFNAMGLRLVYFDVLVLLWVLVAYHWFFL